MSEFSLKGLFLLLVYITATFPFLLWLSFFFLVQTKECFKRRFQRRCVRCDFNLDDTHFICLMKLLLQSLLKPIVRRMHVDENDFFINLEWPKNK